MPKSVFHDLFPAEEAAELEMRAKLLSGISTWPARVCSDANRGGKAPWDHAGSSARDQERKDQPCSLSMPVRLAERAGLRPGIKFEK